MGELRRAWSHIAKYNWKFGLFLIFLFGIPRFVLVLDANMTGSYGAVGIMFVIMWFIPFIFLSKEGRRMSGFRRPSHPFRLLHSFLLGAAFCTLMYFITDFFYADSVSNSLVYIARTYTLPEGALESNKLPIFLSCAFTTMIFSPIGEEFFYRGVIHGSFVGEFGEQKASYFDSIAFALTHLAHFGIIYDAGQWQFLLLPALVWVLFMFTLSQLFFRAKQMCGSIWGAVICHSGFNFAMTYFIFYHIFK